MRDVVHQVDGLALHMYKTDARTFPDFVIDWYGEDDGFLTVRPVYEGEPPPQVCSLG